MRKDRLLVYVHFISAMCQLGLISEGTKHGAFLTLITGMFEDGDTL